MNKNDAFMEYMNTAERAMNLYEIHLKELCDNVEYYLKEIECKNDMNHAWNKQKLLNDIEIYRNSIKAFNIQFENIKRGN